MRSVHPNFLSFLTLLTPPLSQGCYWACISNVNTDAKRVVCNAWAYETKSKRCTLLRNPASSDTATSQKLPCALWTANKGYVSGWTYFGEDGWESYPPCKK